MLQNRWQAPLLKQAILLLNFYNFWLALTFFYWSFFSQINFKIWSWIFSIRNEKSRAFERILKNGAVLPKGLSLGFSSPLLENVHPQGWLVCGIFTLNVIFVKDFLLQISDRSHTGGGDGYPSVFFYSGVLLKHRVLKIFSRVFSQNVKILVIWDVFMVQTSFFLPFVFTLFSFQKWSFFLTLLGKTFKKTLVVTVTLVSTVTANPQLVKSCKPWRLDRHPICCVLPVNIEYWYGYCIRSDGS